MEKIYLSDSGPKVSKAIYSLWRWENLDNFNEDEARKVFSLCLDLGISTFEFSASSKNNKLNKVFFDLIEERKIDRQDLIFLVRVGKEVSEDGYVVLDQSRQALISQINGFLERSGRKYLDIILLDELDYITEIEIIASTLAYMVHSGVAKHIGVANFSSSQYRLLASLLEIPIVTNHLELNLLKPEAIFDGRLDEIKKSFTKPLVWAPLAGGDILEGLSMDKLVLGNTLAEIAGELDANVEQTAVAWLLNLGMLPVIGSPKEQRIRNVVAATSIKLSHSQWYRIFDIVSKFRK